MVGFFARAIAGCCGRCLLGALVLLGSGCASLRGPGLKDEPSFGRKADETGKATGIFGFNQAARDIEKNLGVQ